MMNKLEYQAEFAEITIFVGGIEYLTTLAKEPFRIQSQAKIEISLQTFAPLV